MFKELNRATKCLIPVYYLAGTIIPMTIFFAVGAISQSMTSTAKDAPVNPIFTWMSNFFFAFNPLYTFFVANYSIIMTYFQHQALELTEESTDKAIDQGFLEANDKKEMHTEPAYCFAMFCLQCFIFFVTAVAVDTWQLNKYRGADGKKVKDTVANDDSFVRQHDDVMRHAADVLHNPEADWYVRAVGLEKTYAKSVVGTKVRAIAKDTTFGVRKGTVMGLLGPNGAGKSSTFSILSLESQRSFGEVQLMSSKEHISSL